MFGLENIGKGSVDEAHRTVNDLLVKLDPLLRDASNRIGGILHGLLDRLNGTELNIKITIPPVPKAKAVDE